MLFPPLFRWLIRGSERNQASRPRHPKAQGLRRPSLLSLELLEDRTVPSTIIVTNLADSGTGSLRQAILDANANPGADVIRFAGGLTGTITLTSTNGELNITDDLNINGPGANQLAVSGGNVTRVFHVSGSTTVAINKLTISNGLESVSAGPAFGGGLLNEGAHVRLAKVVFVNNQAVAASGYAGGGAIANLGGAQLQANHIDFLGNTASGGAAATNFGNGGAVYDDQGAIVAIDHSTFSGNLATGGEANGGAIGHYGGSQLTVRHSSFAGNQALALAPDGNAAGGAIESDRNSAGFFEVGPGGQDLGQPVMAIGHCSFTGNQALAIAATAGNDGTQTQGGAMDVDAGAKATVRFSLFVGNSAYGGDGGADSGSGAGGGGRTLGGAILNFNGDLTVTNSRFIGNESHGGNGGAGSGNGGDGAPGSGGAIAATTPDTTQPPTTVIANCRFVGNVGIGGAGGAGGSSGNGGAGGFGEAGGILNRVGTMKISHCSLVQNTAQGGAGGVPGSGGVGGDGGLGRGGGLANERSGTATVTHTAIVNNQALGGAGATGGNGGNAIGGGVYNGRVATATATTLELIDCTVSANLARGGAGGVGGNGGFARGGGIYNGNTSGTGALDSATPAPVLDLDGTAVTANQAVGGAAGAGGVAGIGEGGGLYNDSPDGAVAEKDAFSPIKGNKATTSDDDIFGTVNPI